MLNRIRMTMPVHPRTGLTAVGIVAGRPVWPILGGDDTVEAPPAGSAAESKEATPDTGKGFPDNTPVEQMTPEQQAAYWKDKSRKHEDRSKQFNGLTPERVKELQDLEQTHKQLLDAQKSDGDKALDAAKAQARKEAIAELAPSIVGAELKAVTAGREINGQPINVDALLTAIEPSRFLTDQGAVDADKVRAYVDGIAPAPKATDFGNGKGRSGSRDTGKGSVEAGRSRYAERHKKTTNA